MESHEQGLRPEYQFGDEIRTRITAEKLDQIQNSDMPAHLKPGAMGELKINWENLLEGAEKEQGN